MAVYQDRTTTNSRTVSIPTGFPSCNTIILYFWFPCNSVEKVPKRGRPRKEIQPPSYNDFPVCGSLEEQKHWMKLKNTQYWHYTKLTGPEGEKYQKRESARVSKAYNKKKCLEVEAELPEDDISIIDNKGEDLGETKEDRIKEQNRVR